MNHFLFKPYKNCPTYGNLSAAFGVTVTWDVISDITPSTKASSKLQEHSRARVSQATAGTKEVHRGESKKEGKDHLGAERIPQFYGSVSPRACPVLRKSCRVSEYFSSDPSRSGYKRASQGLDSHRTGLPWAADQTSLCIHPSSTTYH